MKRPSFFKKKEIEEIPLFNLRITLDPTNRKAGEREQNVMEEYKEKCVGDFHVTRDGRLAKEFVEGLHTYTGDVDLSLVAIGEKPHIHYGEGQRRSIDYLLNLEGEIYLSDIINECVLSDELNKPLPIPDFTLKGLYNLLPDEHSLNDRLIILFKSLLYKGRKSELLRILEGEYVKRISNQ